LYTFAYARGLSIVYRTKNQYGAFTADIFSGFSFSRFGFRRQINMNQELERVFISQGLLYLKNKTYLCAFYKNYFKNICPDLANASLIIINDRGLYRVFPDKINDKLL